MDFTIHFFFLGEQYRYGQVAVKNVHELKNRIEFWEIEDEQEIRDTRLECLRATAISSLFNWLNGQAHCAGWTQYTDEGDINLTSQVKISVSNIYTLLALAGPLRWSRILLCSRTIA